MNNSRGALTLEKIGARIRSKRESLGMTQQELSDIVGVSRNTISRYELGQLEMKIMTLCVIAYALQTTPGILLWQTDDTDESKIIAGLQDLCYSPPILSTNRHRILSFRHWLCQAIGILFCQRNEMLLRKTKAINPITNLAHKQIAASSGFESG